MLDSLYIVPQRYPTATGETPESFAIYDQETFLAYSWTPDGARTAAKAISENRRTNMQRYPSPIVQHRPRPSWQTFNFWISLGAEVLTGIIWIALSVGAVWAMAEILDWLGVPVFGG